MKFRITIIALVLVVWVSGNQSAVSSSDNDDLVTIENRGRYYDVNITVPDGPAAHKRVGVAYALELQKKVPGYEKLADGYLKFLSKKTGPIYGLLKLRAKQIKENVPQNYSDEINGLASVFDSQKTNTKGGVAGDGHLSSEELWMLNTLPDIARLTECCAFGCSKSMTVDGNPIVGRNLDWPDGSADGHEMLKLHAVVRIHDHGKDIVSIGFLSCQGIVSGLNDRGLFVSILDSPTGAPYTAFKKRSYFMDLRECLESFSARQEVAAKMMSLADQYAFNHLIFVADSADVCVIENNFSGVRKHLPVKFTPAVRYGPSVLNQGISWSFKDAVGAVNSFLLAGHYDNHNKPLTLLGVEKNAVEFRSEGGNVHNTYRWESMKERTAEIAQAKIDASGIKRIVGFHKGAQPGSADIGDLMNENTLQSIIYEPATKKLEVYFKQAGDTSRTWESVKAF